MASYNELNALIDAYINRNGVQAITGQILNGVLKAMVEQLGRGYTIMGAATPTTDPGTPDGPECYFASTPGTYTDFDGLQVVPGELALLCYTPTDGWTKATIYEGFQEVGATIDGNVGTPSVGVSYANGVLSFDFHNMKGNPGQNGQDGAAAGFGTIDADITGGVGTPGVTVESSGPATAKNLQFHFTNLKGETGVTSVVATVDNTSGTPQCAVSLNGQQLTLAFTGLKGAQGDTGVSADYPITIVNNLTTNDPTSALSAAQGVVLDGKVSQLEAEVLELSTPRSVKNALYSILQNVAFINNTGYSTELAQIRAWAENLVLMSISATFTQGTAEIYDTDSLDKLKRYLVVTATYDDDSTVVLNDSDYNLSGTLAIGTSTITVTYQGKTDTFTVVVTESPYLYVLQSPFTSSGSNSIDTGFRPEKGKTYTILCESQESASSNTPVFIFGNRLTTSSSYQGWTSQQGYVWGLSLPNGNKINVGNNTLRVAIVFNASADDGAMVGITLRYRIGSGAISQRTSEHYGPDMTVVSSTSNFFLGAQYYGTQGFLGVINSFVIFDGEMPLADITDFLTNGM